MRKSICHLLALAAAASSMWAVFGITAHAGDYTRIKSVSLSLDSDIEPGMKVGDESLNITARGSSYKVSGYDITNGEFYWQAESAPEVTIHLYANDGYKFSYIGANNLKISGKKADFISSKRAEKDTLMDINVRLKPLYKDIDLKDIQVNQAQLQPDGTATWQPDPSAGQYQLLLFKDGRPLGNPLLVYGSAYDFSKDIPAAGTYFYKIRIVSKYDGKSRGTWTESGSMSMDQAALQALKLKTGKGLKGHWIKDKFGWKYENPGGGNPFFQWQKIDGSWYYFNPDGYMSTGPVEWNGHSYYCNENGAMLANQTAPDGSAYGPDGAKIK